MPKFSIVKSEKLSFQIDASEIAEVGEAEKSLLFGNYDIMLANQGDLCIQLGRINQGKWFPVPKTCKNCALATYDDCVAHAMFSQVASCQNNDAPFVFMLATLPDPQGIAKGGQWNINPDANHHGAVVGLR